MENFDISRFFKVLNNSKLYVAFVLLFFIVVGYFYSFYFVTPMYSSSATVMLVQNEQMDASSDSITQADITLNQSLLSTYTKIAKSNKVLEQVINNLNLDMATESLAKNVSVQSVNNTEVFKVSVNNENAFLAATITNELVRVFSSEIQSLYNMNNVYLMDEAEVNEVPFNVNHLKDIAMFGIIGFIASFGLVVVIYLFDTTIKSEQDIEEYTGLSVLSTIPIFQNKTEKNFSELIVNEQPKSPIAECFKTFRTNVMFSIQNKALNTILVTSGFMGEGKSFVSSNLAVTFAQSGKKVILIDSDMRKGRLHKIFNISNNIGLSNLLSDIGMNRSSVNINNYIQKSGISNLHVMTSGTVPPNPSELLSSPNMKKVFEALNTQYDIVICDGTPCMLVSDSVILSKIVDTTVIVTANKVTKLDTLQKIKKSIEIVGGNIGGAIINKMNISSKSYQNKYYYGNHNETNFDMDLSNNDNDVILNNQLCINDNIIEDVEDVIINNILDENIDDNFAALSNMISDNTKEIMKLRDLYKTTFQNTINAISKNNSSDEFTKELKNLKVSYENNINDQNNKISDLDTKISNLNINDNSEILDELANIKVSYENSIKEQNMKFENLNDRLSEISNYNMLEELNAIKSDYMKNIKLQNDELTALNEKISNIDFSKYSDEIFDELQNTKSFYENNIKNQNEIIASLEDKISSLIVSDNSEVILNELESIKDNYQSAINTQDEYIASLEDKIANLGSFDNSEILNELDDIKVSYENIIKEQNDRISNLDNKISNLNVNDNSEILQEVANIYKQLSDINSRFDYLEQQAIHNEELIKNLEKQNIIHEKPLQNKSLDIKKLHDNVISIQDYLENEYKVVDLPREASNKVFSKKNKNVLEGQLNIIDNLLENAQSVNKAETSNITDNKFVVDYAKVNNKQKRSLFSFKPKYVEPEYENDEEVNIVSQILAGNSTENVG